MRSSPLQHPHLCTSKHDQRLPRSNVYLQSLQQSSQSLWVDMVKRDLRIDTESCRSRWWRGRSIGNVLNCCGACSVSESPISPRGAGMVSDDRGGAASGDGVCEDGGNSIKASLTDISTAEHIHSDVRRHSRPSEVVAALRTLQRAVSAQGAALGAAVKAHSRCYSHRVRLGDE